jgi:glycosyltransferase involved in cell wall biosynthesis
MKRDDAVLVIAGNDMGYRQRVEEMIERLRLGANVLFTGLLTGNEKRAAYRDADVLVYPAIHEIFGLVPFEAMMCGTPVIVTDDCGCGEIIGREEIGYLVPYNDAAALAAMIDSILGDPAPARGRAARGKNFITQNLSWRTVGARYSDLYHEVLK